MSPASAARGRALRWSPGALMRKPFSLASMRVGTMLAALVLTVLLLLVVVLLLVREDLLGGGVRAPKVALLSSSEMARLRDATPMKQRGGDVSAAFAYSDGVVPAGYTSQACAIKPKLVPSHQPASSEPRSPADAERGEKCLPRLHISHADQTRKKRSMARWTRIICGIDPDDPHATCSDAQVASESVVLRHRLHAVVMAGRTYGLEVVLRAARRMFADRGGVASLVSIVTTQAHKAGVLTMLRKLQFPSVVTLDAKPCAVHNMVHRVNLQRQHGSASSCAVASDITLSHLHALQSKTFLIAFDRRDPHDFRDVYNVTLVDSFLHLKLDDDLLYVHPQFDLLMLHRYVREKFLTLRSDYCEQAPIPQWREERCSFYGRVSRLGPRHAHAACSVLGANIVNHVGLTAVHAAMWEAAEDLSLPWLLRGRNGSEHGAVLDSDFAVHQPSARWAAQHRRFFRSLLEHAKFGVSGVWSFENSSRGGTDIDADDDDKGSASVVDLASDDNSLRVQYDFGLHHYDCDAQPRRWSINAVLFSFGRSVFDGHMPFDDEFFMTKMFHTHVAPAEGRPYPVRICADGRALVVHGAYSFQYLASAHYAGKCEKPRNLCGRARFFSALQRLQEQYEVLARHLDDAPRCCSDTGCTLLRLAPNIASGDAVFPFAEEDGWFAKLENSFVRDGESLAYVASLTSGAQFEATSAEAVGSDGPRRRRSPPRFFIGLFGAYGVSLRIAALTPKYAPLLKQVAKNSAALSSASGMERHNRVRPGFRTLRGATSRSPLSGDAAVDIMTHSVLELAIEQWKTDGKFIVEFPPAPSHARGWVLGLRSAFLTTHCLTTSVHMEVLLATFAPCVSFDHLMWNAHLLSEHEPIPGNSSSSSRSDDDHGGGDEGRSTAFESSFLIAVRSPQRFNDGGGTEGENSTSHQPREGGVMILCSSHKRALPTVSPAGGVPVVVLWFPDVPTAMKAALQGSAGQPRHFRQAPKPLLFYFLDARRAAPIFELQAEQGSNILAKRI